MRWPALRKLVLFHSAWLSGKRCLCAAASRHWIQEHVRRSLRWSSTLLTVSLALGRIGVDLSTSWGDVGEGLRARRTRDDLDRWHRECGCSCASTSTKPAWKCCSSTDADGAFQVSNTDVAVPGTRFADHAQDVQRAQQVHGDSERVCRMCCSRLVPLAKYPTKPTTEIDEQSGSSARREEAKLRSPRKVDC